MTLQVICKPDNNVPMISSAKKWHFMWFELIWYFLQ